MLKYIKVVNHKELEDMKKEWKNTKNKSFLYYNDPKRIYKSSKLILKKKSEYLQDRYKKQKEEINKLKRGDK